MSITAVNPLYSKGTIDAEYHKTYTSVWQVLTNDVNDGPRTARTASFGGFAIPARAEVYQWGNDFDNWAFCTNLDADLEDWKKSRKKWLVTVTHTSRPTFRTSASEIENPLDERPILYGSFIQFQRPLIKDKDGKAVLNVVGEPFTPAPMRDDSRDSLVYECNTATIDLGLRDSFRDAVNSASIWGLGARNVKLEQWTWRIAYAGPLEYVQHRLEFHINTDTYPTAETGQGWDFNILNTGYRHKVDCSSDIEKRMREIMDGRDQPRHHATPLGPGGEILDLACGDTEHYKNFRGYNELDFHSIPFLLDPLPGPFV